METTRSTIPSTIDQTQQSLYLFFLFFHKCDIRATPHYSKGLVLSVQEKKTILRTIRITDDLDRLLRKEAEAKGVNVNGLLNKMIKEYAEWGKYADSVRTVHCPRDTFRFLIEALDDEKLLKLQKLYSEAVRSSLLLRFGRVSEKSFLELVSRAAKYTGLYLVETEMDGRNHILTFHHDLGGRWSAIMSGVLCEFLRNTFDVVPQAEASANSLAINFTLPKT